jgi:RNA polymerase sigma-70 factor (ECF subfamily)
MRVHSNFHQTNQLLQDELDLIKKAQKNPEQFGPLYKKYHEQIFRYIYQRMDDIDLAHDITAQVFMKAILHISTYEYRGVPFSSWLYRIAKSELYQSFRDKKTERTINIDTINVAVIIDEIESDETEENKKHLLNTLSLLKEKDVQLIELRFFEKRSFKEMGEILELTENNAKVKTFRALEKLKTLFLTKKPAL